ncbi:PTS lactose/cellobiose transporter subunit IIA [Vibrio panuliri]|uniref:PTS fructose transporter subunit IIC n=1 Tax=Vibrio panuliri TaxID=1381081 RepID=A0A1Q9HIT7_9VIBR|nr:PTS lactose/cellobiose transporter subunit IIA [Vibrio panuliri]KAB1454247.1 PTS lactose/cellobiose transporter subunit IIA [Vibrio panuliri]OLQ88939.1 PTS fructose transporter subunit IIC [Vibrio panuliri]OLQ90219.1 PTS fructose transporter subunit IIC [Vibrio panuliri]
MPCATSQELEITEEFLMSLLCYVGAARSAFIAAMRAARAGDFEQAQANVKEGDQALKDVHKSQTELIGYDEGAGKVQMTLILTHIQDHIMTTMLCREVTEEIIAIHKELKEIKS